MNTKILDSVSEQIQYLKGFIRAIFSGPLAATELGKSKTFEDEERLIGSLNDEQWWVRYRAGEALVRLESMTEEKLVRPHESLISPKAQEIQAPILATFRARRAPIAVRP